MMRPLDVALLDANGNTVRWRSGARSRVSQLRFTSALPGGFAVCSFVLEQPAARVFTVAGNCTVIVRCGSTVVWWGYTEDIDTVQRGSARSVAVTAYGPWQLFQQRLSSPNYDDVQSSSILTTEMGLYVTEISADVSQIVATVIPLTIDWDNRPVADVVKAVCDAGNGSDQPLFFAIWEPAGSRTQLANAGNLTHDPEMEQRDAEWYFTIGTEDSTFDGVYAHSGRYAASFADDNNDAIASVDKLTVSGSTTYILEYWHYWSAHSGMTVNGRVDWYNASDVFISSSYLTTYTASGAASAWTERRESVTSPSTAATARVMVEVDNNGASRFTVVDDIRIYLAVTSLAADAKPRAHLWSRDLSTYDYILRTSGIIDGVSTVSTTRDLANNVLASYGSSSFTTAAQDTDSQADYRQRDHVLAAGSVAQVDAEAMRDVYLQQHKAPGTEVQSFRLTRQGAVRTATGHLVRLEMLRAGDRLLIVDGPLAGSIVLLDQVEYRDGAVTCHPESYQDASRLLAQI